VRVVAVEREVIDRVVEDRIRLALDDEFRQQTCFACQLQFYLLGVVVVDVRVAAYPDELADFQVTLLCNHVGQKRVAGDVEGHAQEHVSATLVHLAGQLAIVDVELEQDVTRFQYHLLQICRVPGAHDETTGIWIDLDGLDDLANLVDRSTIGRGPIDPLHAVDRTKVAVLSAEIGFGHHAFLVAFECGDPFLRVDGRDFLPGRLQVLHERPLGPDVIVVGEKVGEKAASLQEEQQFADDQAHRYSLGRDQGKPLRQIVPDLLTKKADRTGAGAVAFFIALLENLLKKFLIGRTFLCHLVS